VDDMATVCIRTAPCPDITMNVGGFLQWSELLKKIIVSQFKCLATCSWANKLGVSGKVVHPPTEKSTCNGQLSALISPSYLPTLLTGMSMLNAPRRIWDRVGWTVGGGCYGVLI